MKQKTQNARRSSRPLWAILATLVMGVVTSAAWSARTLTRTAIETEKRQQRANEASDASVADHECDDLRLAMANSRESAGTEGRLAAYAEHRTAASNSHPTLGERITSIFGD